MTAQPIAAPSDRPGVHSAQHGTDHADIDKTWFQYARIALEWLNPVQRLDATDWVRGVVDRAVAANVDALAFDFACGGYALFDQSVADKDRHIGESDIIRLLDEEIHERGLRLILMNMGAHGNSYASDEHKSWRAVDANGHAAMGLLSYAMCLNSPYGNFLVQELRGLLSRYRVDGLYIEGLYGLNCYCRYCTAEFYELFGYQLPRDPEQTSVRLWEHRGVMTRNADYVRFRSSVATDFIRRVNEVIQTVSPATAFAPCPSTFEGSLVDLSGWGQHCDAVALERQWGFSRTKIPLYEIGMSLQIVRAESRRPVIGTLWVGWNVDRDYAPCGAPHYRLNFGEILLHGATPQVHTQTIFEVEPSAIALVKEMFDFEERLRPDILGLEPLRYVALVLDFERSWVSPHFKGYYKALTEAHVPFVVVSKSDLEAEQLDAYAAYVLPNVAQVSDRAVENLAQFVRRGGGLVFTYRTGWEDTDGRTRSDCELYPLAGVDQPRGVFTFGSSASPREVEIPYGSSEEVYSTIVHAYFKNREGSPLNSRAGTQLQSVRGSVAKALPAGGEVWADLVDYDYSRMRRAHPVLGWYPGDVIGPMTVSSTSGGRALYIAGELDRDAGETGQAGTMAILADAARWAAGRQPAAVVDCGITVEAAIHRSVDERRYVVMLVNQASNQLDPGYVVREVQPARDVRILMPAVAGIRDARSVRANKLGWSSNGLGTEIILDRLEEYDAVVIDV